MDARDSHRMGPRLQHPLQFRHAHHKDAHVQGLRLAHGARGPRGVPGLETRKASHQGRHGAMPTSTSHRRWCCWPATCRSTSPGRYSPSTAATPWFAGRGPFVCRARAVSGGTGSFCRAYREYGRLSHVREAFEQVRRRDQLGYVVDDLEQAARAHSALFGSGPFIHFSAPEPKRTLFRGQEVRNIVDVAYGMYGDLQIRPHQTHQRRSQRPTRCPAAARASTTSLCGLTTSTPQSGISPRPASRWPCSWSRAGA